MEMVLEAVDLAKDHFNKTHANTNLVHALLFTGQTEKAFKLYRENSDSVFRDGALSRENVIDDFRQFREASITSPEMERVERMLKQQNESGTGNR